MTGQAYSGHASLTDGTSEFNQVEFLVRQILSKTATTALVQVVSVQGADGVAPVGLCNVKPLVGQIDGAGKIRPHGTIHNVPFFRLQGGANAIIIDPKPGDIGIAVFAGHDISTVKNTKAAAGPGSRRRFDWADALYIGGVLNGTPEQYVRFVADGIEIVSATKITVQAPDIDVVGNVAINGTVTTTGAITAGGDITAPGGITLKTHVHGGVQSGPPTTHSLGPLPPP